MIKIHVTATLRAEQHDTTVFLVEKANRSVFHHPTLQRFCPPSPANRYPANRGVLPSGKENVFFATGV
ncbi:hypothetical protein [Desulfovibrio sp.]|uniref:hypothetical protein n=1 Tax=Desulfovibrio sp. TaxID=885 RepID=UPI0025903C32|nr:hypothetical protein [Desulfovibrio sp.]